ncbi:MAG: MBL fold metallo-hydrolase [Ruminococcaceae bacterium]|nr:MBL fold metallo-hydrolase [Oscillospiraceae bacterium]
MMQVTFLGHSGFLVESDTVCLLFDWSEGVLPPLPEKPLLVFASHRHQDHFRPQIFSLDNGVRDVFFCLGSDLKLTDSRKQRWNISAETAARCHVLKGRTSARIGSATVETLPSTDEGVAFLVTCDGHTIYHAGDLNWWHWEGEDPVWNRNMESNFKRYVEPLRDRHMDLAFAPLDPRQEAAAFWGFRYLLELADISHIIPMHQWKNPQPTRDFCAAYPQFIHVVSPMEAPGQTILF